MAWINLEAEQSTIGGLLLSPDRCHDVVGLVSADDFSCANHRLIYSALQAMAVAGQPIDVVTLTGRLETAGQLGQVGGLVALASLVRSTPSAANVTHYASAVRDCAVRRRLRDVLSRAAHEVERAEFDALLGEVTTAIESVAVTGGGYLSFQEALTRALDHIDTNARARACGGVVGVPTGLPAVDNRTGGLQAQRLIVLAARPSIGKTALANQIAIHAASRGFPVGILSLEMSHEELVTRSLAHTFELNVSAISFGDDAELGRLVAAMAQRNIADLPIQIDTDTTSLGGIVARLSEWRRKHGIELGIVDHIGLVEGGDNSTRNDWMGKVSRTLKLTAKRLGIPILAVSQLSRGVERDKRRPVLSDLRDSGNIEQDADVCMFIHVEGDAVPSANKLPLEIGLLKNRIGRRGWLSERFAFDGRTQTIREI